MTEKEKAKELFNKYIELSGIFVGDYESEKEMCLIAVDEILDATKKYVAIREKVTYSKTGFDNVVHTQYDPYWKEVKQEIEKL